MSRKDFLEKQAKERLGEVITNKYGEKITIIEYKNSNNVFVEFDNGYKKIINYRSFTRTLSNPYSKSIFGVGCIGEGEYKSKNTSGKITKEYNCWSNMMKRCYYNKDENYKTYEDKYVCEEWHNFQNFAKWFNENYYEVKDKEKMDLDKDILFKNNKVYSPETCVFVPHKINSLFIKSNASRGKYPIGVTFRENENKFVLSVYHIKDNKFNTIEDAFEYYKKEKEQYIKQVAEEYKDSIPVKLYNAMINYIVEIDD